MGNMVVATVTIEGVRPLLWHIFTLDAIPLEERIIQSGVPGNDPEEWKRTYLATPEGQLYLEPNYIFSCFKEGGKHVKHGRTYAKGLVAATLQVISLRILIDRFMPSNLADLTRDPAAPVYLDVRSVKNPVTRSRNIRYRVAVSPGWLSTFQIRWDLSVLNEKVMHAVIIDAGRLCGIGGARQIGFGRFDIKAFDVAMES